jgi:hypothetical protein
MAKREANSPEYEWENPDDALEAEESAAELQQSASAPTIRPGFHLLAARKIEEAHERRQLRKAIEDFDDYDV